jgi:glycosyltransferase involved in cell wall biosynthesis
VEITVVVPSRDRPRLLEEALRSLAGQTRGADQVVVVDDGSDPPLSEAALRSMVPGLEFVRHDRPRGVSAARNSGLERARGGLVLFLDDDDLLHPETLQAALEEFARQPEAGAVVFGYRCFGDPEPGLENPAPPGALEARPASAFLRYLVPVHSCVVRRDAVGALRFPETLVQGEDTWFWIALAAAGCRFVQVDRECAWVRRHAGNTSGSRARYRREIQACCTKLLEDGLLRDPGDAFLAHLKLAWFQLREHGRPGRHLARVAASPRRLAGELAFWALNFGRRWRASRGARRVTSAPFATP